MRIPTIVLVALLGSASGTGAANDGPWCYRDIGGPQQANCSFYSLRQCLIVAGTMGGVCARYEPPVQDAAKPSPSKKAGR